MRRPAPTLAVLATAILAAACAAAADPSVEAGRGTPATPAPTPSPEASDPGVDATGAPALAWTFGDEVTTEAGTVSLELTGGHEFAGNGVSFDGQSGSAVSVEGAPVDTESSFSVSAWVSLADPVEYAVAVSQVGAEAAVFYLGIGESTWDFAMRGGDTNEPGGVIRAKANPGLVDIGEWFHLVGVHDVEKGEVRLYVNGTLSGRARFEQPWQAEGALTIGRSQAHSAQADFWPGSIASVAIYAGALTSADVRRTAEETEPPGEPPATTSVAASLRGTWDYVLDEAGRDVVLENFAGLVDSADDVVVRFGFDGNDWWLGFLFDGELFLLDGVPEGDGGFFFLVPGEPTIVMSGAHGEARIAYEWEIDGDSLTMTATEECVVGVELTCTADRSEMDPIMLLVTDQTFARSGDDPSY